MFVYKISSGHDIAEILRMLALNTNQSINVDRKSTVLYEDFFYIKCYVFLYARLYGIPMSFCPSVRSHVTL
jgi:hypothetical protein